MSSTIYSSIVGAKAAWSEMEMVSNNLANATSDGFKAHRLALQRIASARTFLIFVKAAETVSDMSDGTQRPREWRLICASRPSILCCSG